MQPFGALLWRTQQAVAADDVDEFAAVEILPPQVAGPKPLRPLARWDRLRCKERNPSGIPPGCALPRQRVPESSPRCPGSVLGRRSKAPNPRQTGPPGAWRRPAVPTPTPADWGCCTGRGLSIAPSNWKCRPEKSTSSPLQSFLMTSRHSSVRRPRWFTRRPEFSNSTGYSPPIPTPRVSRPLDAASNVAVMRASISG